MKLLEDRIIKDGYILPGNVLKVDKFLNQQLDVELIAKLAEEWKHLYANDRVTKIMTIEASGIALASIAGLAFGVPVVYAKKTISAASSADNFTTKVVSFTHGNTYNVNIPKSCLNDDDRVLIIDDFLSNGSALHALIKLCEKSGAAFVGAGIAIEKAFNKGGRELRKKGYRIESLAMIKSMDPAVGFEFC